MSLTTPDRADCCGPPRSAELALTAASFAAGPACSDTVEPIAGVSRHYNVVVISYSAEGVLFSNRSQYPYFFRTIGENKQFR